MSAGAGAVTSTRYWQRCRSAAPPSMACRQVGPHCSRDSQSAQTHPRNRTASRSRVSAAGAGGLMTAKFKDEFVDRLLAEGEAKGEARTILRVLAARGLEVPAKVREQVLSCTDSSQLETWIDRAAIAVSVEEVFGP